MWQPIETAPKDGTIILVYCPVDDGLLVERFGAAEWEGFDDGEGFWIHCLEAEPTHWMPLPEPPAWPRGRRVVWDKEPPASEAHDVEVVLLGQCNTIGRRTDTDEIEESYSRWAAGIERIEKQIRANWEAAGCRAKSHSKSQDRQ